nr:SDR family oxidoreductase [Nocardia vaccinii]
MDIETSQFDKTIEVNQRGSLVWTQCAYRQALVVVLNISSIGAFRTVKNLAVYNMSKAALVHLTQQLAYELAPGVRVAGIAPGLVETTMAKSLTDPRPAGGEAADETDRPAGRHREHGALPGLRRGELAHWANDRDRRRSEPPAAFKLTLDLIH